MNEQQIKNILEDISKSGTSSSKQVLNALKSIAGKLDETTDKLNFIAELIVLTESAEKYKNATSEFQKNLIVADVAKQSFGIFADILDPLKYVGGAYPIAILKVAAVYLEEVGNAVEDSVYRSATRPIYVVRISLFFIGDSERFLFGILFACFDNPLVFSISPTKVSPLGVINLSFDNLTSIFIALLLVCGVFIVP